MSGGHRALRSLSCKPLASAMSPAESSGQTQQLIATQTQSQGPELVVTIYVGDGDAVVPLHGFETAVISLKKSTPGAGRRAGRYSRNSRVLGLGLLNSAASTHQSHLAAGTMQGAPTLFPTHVVHVCGCNSGRRALRPQGTARRRGGTASFPGSGREASRAFQKQRERSDGIHAGNLAVGPGIPGTGDRQYSTRVPRE